MRASTVASSNQMVNDDEHDDEYDYQMPVAITPNDYMTTTLVCQHNITLADLFLTVFNRAEFVELEYNLLKSMN